MQFENFSFGSLRIDGSTYEQDVIIDRGKIRKRQKKPSKNLARTLDTRHSLRRRKYHGSATDS